MPIAVDPNRTWNYVLECDRPKTPAEGEAPTPPSSPTTWKLKPLTCREHARLQDGIASVDRTIGVVNVASGTNALEACRMGLVGVENFFDSNGAPVKFLHKFDKTYGRDFVTYDFLDCLRPEWRDELAKAITERSEITEADAKNS